MPDLELNKLPLWFWIVAGVALLWNLMGVGAYFVEVGKSAEDLAALSEDQRMLYENIPAWAVGAFALAVFGGAVGCVLLLLRKKIAVPVLSVSLAGIVAQMFHSFFIANTIAIYGPGAAIMPGMVIVIGCFLVWFAISSKTKGWIS